MILHSLPQCSSACLSYWPKRVGAEWTYLQQLVLIPGTTKKKVMGLERGPLSLVSTTEKLLDRKVAAPV
jgi:hypothetical protein